MAHGPRKNETDAPKRISSTFEFVPSPEHVLGKLVPSYILTVIYQALIDSAAAEQGARRKAMHSRQAASSSLRRRAACQQMLSSPALSFLAFTTS